ncbi:antirestriction protein [Psychromicrobium silvestre]|uniref:Antirestriction protein n=1 Tax=Psychromicrobium silvestre TaxID=1645614 RepID=A0A7Y9S891_9MICC|nr:antirestriction protein ArdA [Psychromicrobium silvestre]NYE95167.1 antirestriction protein [Psychromicrobium silvestre]
MNHEHSPGADPERSHQRTTPAIYVASLADYNNGRLLGDWIDATIGAEAIYERITAILARSTEPAPEEWAIHDYEGFGNKGLSKYERIEDVAALAEGIEQHGEAFCAWVDYTGLDPEDRHHFEDAYLGEYDSLTAYAEQITDDLGWRDEVEKYLPESLQPYVKMDAEAMAEDMRLNGEIYGIESGSGIYVFNSPI